MREARGQRGDLTQGSIVRGLLGFALPLMLGNVLQQCYNLADTIIVGRLIGSRALAAVGSAYTLMILLTSILLGLSMGAGAYLSICFGRRDEGAFRQGNALSFVGIGLLSLLLLAAATAGVDAIIDFMRVPGDVAPLMRQYTLIIFAGIPAVFLYNYFACVLRAIGRSGLPLLFLGISSGMNIVLDLVFVAVLDRGIAGAAEATVISQAFSGLGIALAAWRGFPMVRFSRRDLVPERAVISRIASLALLTSLQQSIMNFGILLVQGRVNSFGAEVMAAFAAGVKIDTLAYSPVQDFGNAFSTFVAQNSGAGRRDRIREGLRRSALAVLAFCLLISAVVWLLGPVFMGIFTSEREIIGIGAGYLRIEGVFYCLIGFLFLFYGYFRAVEQPLVSVVLTVISLGTRVLLAYELSALPLLGVTGIWMSIPIGWALADLAGLWFLRRERGMAESGKS